jgi:hypothetical protein
MADTGDNIYTLLSSLAWPGSIAFAALIFKERVRKIADTLVERFKTATKVKIAVLELEGQYFAPKESAELPGQAKIAGNKRQVFAANKIDLANRLKIYEASKYILLGHKIAPSELRDQKYDVSVFLVRKTSSRHFTANFDTIERVTYYLGPYFGQSEFGSKFVVNDPSNGFAMKTSAHGEVLCTAEILFKDGSNANLQRFLDFSMGEVFQK